MRLRTASLSGLLLALAIPYALAQRHRGRGGRESMPPTPMGQGGGPGAADGDGSDQGVNGGDQGDDQGDDNSQMNPEDCPTPVAEKQVCGDEGCTTQLYCNGVYIGDKTADEGSGEGDEGSTGPGDQEERRPRPEGSDDAQDSSDGADDSAERGKAAGPMSLADAKVNIGTIIETYVREKSPKGYFALKDKTGKVWTLDLDKVRDAETKKLATNLFATCALFRSAPGGDHFLDIDFAVNFGANPWKVSEVRIHRVDGKPRFRYDARNRRVPVTAGALPSRRGRRKRGAPAADDGGRSSSSGQ